MNEPRIITTLMRQVEGLQEELHLRGEVAANPFPLLSGEEIIAILHPIIESPAIRPASRNDNRVAKRRAIARRTHQMIRAGKSGMEIRDAVQRQHARLAKAVQRLAQHAAHATATASRSRNKNSAACGPLHTSYWAGSLPCPRLQKPQEGRTTWLLQTK